MAKDTIEDVDEPLEEAAADEDLDELEPSEEDLESTAAVAAPADAVEDPESLQELLVKQEAAEDETPEEEDEPILVTMSTEERAEPLDARVVPMQASEFVCSNCFLVKHRSQLADRKKMLCRDCA